MADSGQAKTEDPRARLDNIQKRFDSYIERRNELNDLARKLREERDLLHDGRKGLKERLDQAKAERDRLNDEMRKAKERRNELQNQAKALIGSRKGKAGDASKSLPLQARQLEKEIRDMEMKQQTTPHTIEKERELLKVLKAKSDELKQLKAQLDKSREVKVDLDNLDTAIDDLFKQADAEHARVQELYKEASKHHEEFVQLVEESRVLTREANEKHKAYIEVRERSNEQHQKAMELREEMITIRGERRAEFEARKKELNEYNQSARQAVADPRKLEEKADEELELLKKGGKISFGV